MKSLLTLFICSLFLVSCKKDSIFGDRGAPGGAQNANGSSQPSQGTGNGNGTLDLVPGSEIPEAQDAAEMFNEYMEQFDDQSYDIIKDNKIFASLGLPDQGFLLVPYSVASSDTHQGVDHMLFYYSNTANSFLVNFKIIKADETDPSKYLSQDFAYGFVMSAYPVYPMESAPSILPSEDGTPLVSTQSSTLQRTKIVRVLQPEKLSRSTSTQAQPEEYQVKLSIRFDLYKNIFLKIEILDDNSKGPNTVFISRLNLADPKNNVILK